MQMKRKLFFKEFMGNKKITFFISIVLTLSFLLCGFDYVVFSSSINKGYKPDVYINGIVSDNVFELYSDTDGTVDYIKRHIGKDIMIIPCVTRRIASCTERNRFNSVTYSVKGYSQEYISDDLSKYVSEGRIPSVGKNEVIIGSRFAKAMKLSVGDIICGQTVNIGALADVAIIISLEKDPDYLNPEEYLVSGIMSQDCTFLEYSAVVALHGDIKPNTIELYFDCNDAERSYRTMIDNMPGNEIGGVNELYVQKRDEMIDLITNTAIISFAILIIIYLVISLLVKGINKKLSVLKALGITDRYIVSSFWGGILLIMLMAVAFAMLMLIVGVIVLNQLYSDFIGANLIKFKLDFMFIVYMLLMCFFIGINLWAILKYKIAKVNPKIDI